MKNKEKIIVELLEGSKVSFKRVAYFNKEQKWFSNEAIYSLGEKDGKEAFAKEIRGAVEYFINKKSEGYNVEVNNNKYVFSDGLKTLEMDKGIGKILGFGMNKGNDKEDANKDLVSNKKRGRFSPAFKKGLAVFAAILTVQIGYCSLKKAQIGTDIKKPISNDNGKRVERINDYTAIYENKKTESKLFDLRIEKDLEKTLTNFTQYVNKIAGVNYTTDECMKILLWINEINNDLDINYDEEILEKFSQIAGANHFDIVQHRLMGKELEQSYFERTPEHFVSDPEGNAFLTVLFNKINKYVEAEYNHNHDDAKESAKEAFDFIVDTYWFFEPTNTAIGEVNPASIPNTVKANGISEAYAAIASLSSILGIDYSVERYISDGMGGTKPELIGFADMNQILNDQLQKLDLRFDPDDKENIDVIIKGEEENKVEDNTVFQYLSQDGSELKTVYIPTETVTPKQLIKTI